MTDEVANDICSQNHDELQSPTDSEETVDPRVKIELERLNAATDLINKLEIELDEARSNFRLLLSESSHRVNNLAKKLGSCVDKARPYYEARMKAKQLQTRAQKAALRYERASSSHSAAKEMVYLAEEGLKQEGRCFDPAWQEMLNHATMKVNESECERILSQHEHQQTSLAYMEAEKTVHLLHQELKRAITKSRPYFEMKAHFNQLLDEQRKKVHSLEENVLKVKMSYADALHNLEEISDEIHQKRELLEKSMNEKIGSQQNIVWNNCLQAPYQQLPENSTIECEAKRESVSVNSNTGLKHMVFPSLDSTQTCDSDNLHNTKGDTRNSEACVSNTIIGALNKLTLDKDHPQLYNSSQNSSQALYYYPSESSESSDQKHHITDMNILRIQREDISDSESLASNDTVDTLDDNQIECLLLDQVFSSCEKKLSDTDS